MSRVIRSITFKVQLNQVAKPRDDDKVDYIYQANIENVFGESDSAPKAVADAVNAFIFNLATE